MRILKVSCLSSFIHLQFLHKLLFSLVLTCIFFSTQSNGQVTIVSAPGAAYNNTDAVTSDIYGPEILPMCSRIEFSVDFEFDDPWIGSGDDNMEASDECGNCAGDPNNADAGDCEFCWDFFLAEFLIDGGIVYSEIIGVGSPFDALQTGTIAFDYCAVGVGANTAQMNISTQTWAGDENIAFSNVSIICYTDTPNLPLLPNLCETDAAIPLGTTQDGYTGSWSGPGVSGNSFDPSLAGSGTATLTFTPLAAECAFPSDVDITVTPATTPTFSLGPYCSNSTSETLPATSTEGISGTWSGTGITGTDLNPSAIGAGTTTLTFTPDGGQCASQESIDVTISASTPAGFNDPLGTYCVTTTNATISTFSPNGVTGFWSGPGITGTNTFNPSVAGAGTITLTFNVDPPAPAQCAINETFTVVVENGVPVNLAPIGPFCAANTPVALNTVQDGISGSWSGAGVVGGTSFDPNLVGIGTTTILFTPSPGQCTDQPNYPLDVTILTAPTLITPAVPLEGCDDGSGSASFDLTTFNNQVTSTFPSTIIWSTDMTGLSPIGDPTAFVGGNGTVWATVEAGGCPAGPVMVTLEVVNGPAANGQSIIVCGDESGNAIVDLTLLDDNVNGGNPGNTVTWFLNLGGTLVPDPTAFSTSGGNVFAVVDDGSCTSNALIAFTVNPSPSINPTSLSACDEGGNTANFNLDAAANTVNNGTGNTVEWFTDPGGNNPIAVTNPYNSGSVTIYAQTVEGNCTSAIEAITLTVDPTSEAFDANFPNPPCDDGSGTASFDLTTLDNTVNGGTGATVNWFTDAGASNPIGDPTNYAAGAGSVYATVSGLACPSNIATITLSLLTAPTAITPADPIEICYTLFPPSFTENIAAIENQINGGSGLQINWYVDAAGSNPLDPNDWPTLLANGWNPIYATVFDGTCESLSVPVVVNLTPNPVTTQVAIPPACGDATGTSTFDLTAFEAAIGGGNTVIFSTDNGGNNPIANPGSFTTGSTTIFATATNGSCQAATVALVLTVNPQASISSTFFDVCGDLNGTATIDLTSENLTVNNGTGSTVNWFTDAAGNNPIFPASAFTTDATTVYAQVDDGGCPSDILPISITVRPAPQAVSTIIPPVCDNGSGLASFDLTAVDVIVNMGTGNPVSWFEDEDLTIPILTPNAFLSGTASVYAQVTGANGCSSSTTVFISVEPAPTAFSPSFPLQACSDGTGLGEFDLTIVDFEVNGGTGFTVNWFTDPDTFDPIFTPNSYFSGSTFVYAIVSDGQCSSTAVPVQLVVNDLPAAFVPAIPPLCEDGSGSGTTTINLNLFDTEVNGGTGFPVNWFIDSGGNTPVPDPTNFVTNSTIVYAVVVDGTCPSLPTPVVLQIEAATPTSTPDPLQACDLGSELAEFDLSSLQATITNGAPNTVDWYLDMNLNTPIISPNDFLSGATTVFAVANNGSCPSAPVQVELVVTPGITINLDEVFNVECAGDNNGSATISVSGGQAGGYTYNWNVDVLDGTEDPSDLAPGDYSLTVTDMGNCEQLLNFTITEPNLLMLACSEINGVSTIGGNDGLARLTITGGTAPYTIDYTGPLTGTLTATNTGTTEIDLLPAGNYEVLLTDANGCTELCTFTISSPNCTLALAFNQTNLLCNNDNSGSIDLTISGADGTVTIDWNVDALDGIEDPMNLAAATYNVTVTDEAGCEQVQSITLTEPALLTSTCVQLSAASTVGGNDGQAQITIFGGTPSYTISYTGPVSGSVNSTGNTTLNNLVAGSYDLTITDANACTFMCAVVIEEPSCNLNVGGIATAISCFGAADGRIDLTVNGAIGTPTFDWNVDALDGTEDPDLLEPGTYQVTVTDEAGCSVQSLPLTIMQPNELLLTCEGSLPTSTVGGNDGQATITITGGTAPFTISYTGATSGSLNANGTSTITMLPAGNYNVTVTDDNGCTQTCEFTVDPPDCPLSVSISGNNLACNNDGSGSIELTIEDAVGTPTIDWNIDALDGVEDPTGLAAGSYQVTVTDEALCVRTTDITLSEPPAIVLNCSEALPASTIGGSDGAATVDITGGPAPFTITYNGPASGSLTASTAGEVTISALAAGTYTIMVTAANGCSEMCTVTITDPACPLNLAISATDNSCFGDMEGAINLTVNDANGAVTFDWNIDQLDGIQNPTMLEAGFYEVTVTDEAGCSAVESATVGQPSELVLSCTQTMPTSAVGTDDGQFQVIIAGGTVPFEVSYTGVTSGLFTADSNGPQTIDNAAAGTYTITVEDANGCTESCTVLIEEPDCSAINATITATNIACFGDNDGALDLTVNGATGTLTFDWNIDALDGTEDPSLLAPGTYEVTVTDQEGCQAIASATIIEPAQLTLACAEASPVSTVGGNDGSAQITITGGTAPFNIEYTGPTNGSTSTTTNGPTTIDMLQAGNYAITVTDDNGCMQNCSVTITDPACSLTATITATNVACLGDSNGALNLTVNGATGTLTFDWNIDALDGIEDPTLLGPGTYEVTITDQEGCQAIASATITEPAELSLACAEASPVSTVGGNDGSAQITITGGTAPFNIEYTGPTNGATSATTNGSTTIDMLQAGNYAITVTDNNGCMQNCSITITDPTCSLTATIDATNISCFGDNDGAIDLTVNGATGTLTFDWNIDALDGTEDPTLIGPGTYEVTVTDQEGCQAIASAAITEPAELSLACAEASPVSTVGGNDGSAQITITGGTAPFTIEYTGPTNGSTSATTNGSTTIDMLQAGNYAITVTDNNGCMQNCSVTITDPSCSLTATIATTNIACFGDNNGTLNLTVNGATGTLDFDWNIDALDGTEDPTLIGPGTYEVTVTDQEGCQAIASATITEPAELSLACAEASPVSTVGGNDGSAQITITGGTAPFTIEYTGPTNGSTSATTNGSTTIDMLQAGNYAITVTDNNGCMQNCSITITDPTCSLTATIDATNISCFGDNDGAIDLTVNGATGTLDFNWNIDALDGTEDPTLLGPGTYEVTITDQEGCSAIASSTITEPAQLILACAEASPVSTVGGNDGSAQITITGGTAPFNIEYTGPTNGSTSATTNGPTTIDMLQAGNYAITVTDNNGCMQNCSVTITDPSCSLTATIATTNIACFGDNNGALNLTVNGATGTLTFDWNIDTLDDIEDPTLLAPGTYEVTVTDQEGCTAIASSTITEPAELTLACAEASPVSTVGGNDGSAQITITGGMAPFTIAYTGPTNGSTSTTINGPTTIDMLQAGNYAVTVTDNNGCIQNCSVTITDPSCSLTATITATNIACFGDSNGALDLTVNGATGTLTFDWNIDALDGAEDPTLLTPGTYEVTVTDQEGCSAIASSTITEPAQLTLACAEASPVSTVGGNDGSTQITITGGTAPFTIAYTGPTNGATSATINGPTTIDMLQAGNYDITVTDDNGCMQNCSFTITDPSCSLTATIAATNIACFGDNNGALDLTVNGATGTLTFDWNIDALDGIEDPTLLAPGTYEVTITDQEGCTAIASSTITEPAAITLGCAESNPVSTIGGSDGQAEITLDGGTAPFLLDYVGPANGSLVSTSNGPVDIDNLMAGDYDLTVTDANGCVTTCSFTITAPTCTLELNFFARPVACAGEETGSIELTILGAVGATTIDWSDDALDGIEDPNNLAPGTYGLTVTDAINCVATASIEITEIAALLVSCSEQSPVSAPGGTDGAAAIDIIGGTAPYLVTYMGPVSGAASSEDVGILLLSDLPAGTYTADIVDDNGCTTSCTFTITSAGCMLSVSAEASNISCFGLEDGAILLTAEGGFGALTFDWSNDTYDGQSSALDLGAGTYTVTVTDEAACQLVLSETLTAPSEIEANISIINPSCFGDVLGQLQVDTIFGGAGSYELSLDGEFFQAASTFPIVFSNLEAGNYELTIQDISDCTTSIVEVILAPEELILELGDDQEIKLGDSLLLNTIEPSFTIDSAIWSPVLYLDNPFSSMPIATPLETTTYTLTAFDSLGCVVSDEITIFVNTEGGIYVPNVFSPNGDGFNDFFTLFAGDGVLQIESLRVFDRWGGIMYERLDFQPNVDMLGWNGRHRGEAMNVGVYVYYAEVRLIDGTVQVLTGDVTLVK